MGRPLNKKYFGNRNPGGIGSESVASYGSIAAGTGWTTAPTVTFGTPNTPGGVAVDATAHFKALSFATTANGTGYDVGNILEVTTGTAATKARAPVASVVVTNVALVDNGALYDAGNTITFSGAGWTQPLIITVDTADGGGNILTFTMTQAGRRDAAVPTNPVSGGVTGQGTGIDTDGSGATFNLTWGVYSFGTVTVAGDYTVFPSTGGSGTLTSIAPATGTGAKADITMGLLSVAVTSGGSGYTSVADAQVTFSGATGAAATAVLTNASENAIIIYANTDDAGAKAGDIVKQEASRRYKVTTADGTAFCRLVADATPAVNEAYIIATAASTATYYVTKLTAHRATLVAKTGDGALDGQSVQWTFDAPSGSIVQIENA